MYFQSSCQNHEIQVSLHKPVLLQLPPITHWIMQETLLVLPKHSVSFHVMPMAQ